MAINQRKLEHLQLLQEDGAIERGGAGFDALRLSHRALPELDYDAIDCSEEFLGKRLRFPLIISSMTGGSGAEINTINRRLAEAAEHCQVALALGSQRVMFEDSAARASFALRPFAPSTVLVGNLGAVQLNYGFSLNHCEAALEVLAGDGLYLHLNPLQEAIQPEGDRNFTNLAVKIRDLAGKLSKPLLIKEVGASLAPADLELLAPAPIAYFDLAGRGGTSWSRIEGHRASNDLGFLFQDWGLSTVEALTLNVPRFPQCKFIASGGVRNGIHMAKALILGAQLCGLARPFLDAARESTNAVITAIEKLGREYKTALFLLGCKDNGSLRLNRQLIL